MPHTGHNADRGVLDPVGIGFDEGQSECVGELPAAEDDGTSDLVEVPEGAVGGTVGIDGGLVVPLASQPDGMAVSTVLGGHDLESSPHIESQHLRVELRQGWFARKMDQGILSTGKDLAAPACSLAERIGLGGRPQTIRPAQPARNSAGT